MTNPHIHQTPTNWVVIARMHDGKRQILGKQDKYVSFPSEAAALQFMKAEGWSDELIESTFFAPVEDDE
jgi:hypothetical protein